MGSSGGDSGAGSMAMMMQGSPMPGLPVAGRDTAIDPYNYGQFQNFLPEIQAEGQNPMATGLRPEMFEYRSPSGKVDPGVGDQIQQLRDQLAAIQTQQGQPGPGMVNSQFGPLFANNDPNSPLRGLMGGNGQSFF